MGGHTWYELIYRQCLLRLIRNTSGPGSSSSVRGLTLGSPLDLADFLDFFFFFFFAVVVVSSASDKAASGGGDVGGTPQVMDGSVEGTCPTIRPVSVETCSIAIAAMDYSGTCVKVSELALFA